MFMLAQTADLETTGPDDFRMEARPGELFQRRGQPGLAHLEHEVQKGMFMLAQPAMALVDHSEGPLAAQSRLDPEPYSLPARTRSGVPRR